MLVNLEINRENLKRNLEKIRSINKNIVCVIKDNAYGLGIENIFPILLESNCNYFAVAYIQEAIKIREILKKFEPENIDIKKVFEKIKNFNSEQPYEILQEIKKIGKTDKVAISFVDKENSAKNIKIG